MREIRKILFITLSNVGDAILTTPVLSVLKGNFPSAKIAVLVGPRAFEIFNGSAMVDEIIIYDKTASWLDQWEFVKELRHHAFDLVVDLKNSLIPYLLRPSYQTSFVRQHLSKIISKREQHLACLKPLEKSLEIKYDCRIPFDFYSQRDLVAVKEKLRRKKIEPGNLVLLAPGANSHIKRWYVEGFAHVADHLIHQQKKTVVLIGAKSDWPVIDEIIKRSGEMLVDMSGETSLRELAALVSLADLLVANDSSPMQLAYEMKVPVVSIFGPTDEKKFGRENEISVVVRKNLSCTPCESAQCLIPQVKACLLGIDPEEVYQACLKVLSTVERLRNVLPSV